MRIANLERPQNADNEKVVQSETELPKEN